MMPKMQIGLDLVAAAKRAEAHFALKLRVGIPPAGIELELPLGPVAACFARVLRRAPRGIFAVPCASGIKLTSYCEGFVVIRLCLFHPGSKRCPIDEITVHGWLFGARPFAIQPFSVRVDRAGKTRWTEVDLSLKLGESEVNTIKMVLGSEVVDSSVLRSFGVPYDQHLWITYRTNRRAQAVDPSWVSVPRVAIQAVGSLSRPASTA